MAQFPKPHLWKYSASCVDVIDIKTSKENFSTPAKTARAKVCTVSIVDTFV
jgi:hypothetical protein